MPLCVKLFEYLTRKLKTHSSVTSILHKYLWSESAHSEPRFDDQIPTAVNFGRLFGRVVEPTNGPARGYHHRNIVTKYGGWGPRQISDLITAYQPLSWFGVTKKALVTAEQITGSRLLVPDLSSGRKVQRRENFRVLDLVVVCWSSLSQARGALETISVSTNAIIFHGLYNVVVSFLEFPSKMLQCAGLSVVLYHRIYVKLLKNEM